MEATMRLKRNIKINDRAIAALSFIPSKGDQREFLNIFL
jgi:hypothetical protein